MAYSPNCNRVHSPTRCHPLSSSSAAAVVHPDQPETPNREPVRRGKIVENCFNVAPTWDSSVRVQEEEVQAIGSITRSLPAKTNLTNGIFWGAQWKFPRFFPSVCCRCSQDWFGSDDDPWPSSVRLGQSFHGLACKLMHCTAPCQCVT